jgi:pimeloyl-ACP methyl ester carboxylesterase
VIGAKYASEYPETVRRLMLGSFLIRASEGLRDFAPKCLDAIARGAKRDIAELFISTFGSGMAESYCDLIRKQFDGLSVGELAQLELQCEGILARPDIRDFIDFSRITARVLVANGADDPLIREADNELTRQTLPHADVRVIPGVGHFLHLQDDRVVDEHYLSFLQRATASFRVPSEALQV